MKVIDNDASLSGYYQEWKARYDAVCKRVSLARDVGDGSSDNESDEGRSSDGGSEDEEGSGDDSGSKVLCTTCKPNRQSRLVFFSYDDEQYYLLKCIMQSFVFLLDISCHHGDTGTQLPLTVVQP